MPNMHATTVKAAPAIEAAAKRLYGEQRAVLFTQAMDDMVAVDALAKLLDRALNACTSKDGRLDLRDTAAFVLREIRECNR